MSRLRVYVTDRDGNPLAQLPAGKIGTIDLGLVDRDNATISADPSELAELRLVDRELQAWIDDEPSPRLIGVPFTASKGLDARRVSVPVLGLETYFDRWILDADLEYVDVDQLSIGANLIAWAQGRAIPGADANIDAATFTLSGVTRTRRYAGDELDSIGEILGRFRDLTDGYDWSIEAIGADRREWTPHYPRKGTARDAWHLRYRQGSPGNVAQVGYNLDGSQITRRHHATTLSDGDGPSKLIGTYLDPTLDGLDGRLLIETVSSESSSIGDVATLESHGQARVEARRNVARTWEALVVDPVIAMGIETGDTLEVDLDDGWQAYAGMARVYGIRLDPIAERAILTLAEDD